MIYSHEHKSVFFRVPKTGTTSMTTALVGAGIEEWPKEYKLSYHNPLYRWYHSTPQVAYDEGWLTDEMLETYKLYAFIRHPCARFYSAWMHCYRTLLEESVLNNRIDLGMWSKWDGGGDLEPLMMEPQVGYYFVNGEQVIQPLLHEDFDNEIRRMFREVGLEQPEEIPFENIKTKAPQFKTWEEVITEQNQKKILTKFMNDCILWEKINEEKENENR